MLKGLKAFIAACAVLVLMAGCTTFEADSLAFIPDNNGMEVVGHFAESKMVVELLGDSGGANLFNITSAAMREKITAVIWQEVHRQGGDAAINIEIEYWHGPLMRAINIITFGILAPSRISIEGDVVKMHAADSAHDEASGNMSNNNAYNITIQNIQQALPDSSGQQN